MTAYEIYVFFGPPVIAVLMALGASWLVKNDYRKLAERKKAAENQLP